MRDSEAESEDNELHRTMHRPQRSANGTNVCTKTSMTAVGASRKTRSSSVAANPQHWKNHHTSVC